MEPKLIKIDKNGSKHWEGLITCERCYGTGHYGPLSGYNGVCFECNGSGKRIGTWIERTPEYQAKLDERRRKAAEARENQLRAKARSVVTKWCANNGFNAEGYTWVVLGDTYSIKDELKANGAKFCRELGWHMDHCMPEYMTVKLHIDTVVDIDPYGDCMYNDKCREVLDSAIASIIPSNYVGTVGERVTCAATYRGVLYTTETRVNPGYYGIVTTYTHAFKTDSGDTLIWRTGKTFENIEVDQPVVITGTVKDHSMYRGKCNTYLTRCKVMAN